MAAVNPSPSTPLQVLIPLFDGVNTLDVNGPLDVFCNYAIRNKDGSSLFSITTTARDDIYENVKAYEFITLKADFAFSDVKSDIKAGNFDILLLPGAGPGVIENLLKKDKDGKNDPINEIVQLFKSADNKNNSQKWIVSICTGALLAGGNGVFAGLDATTHWAALSGLVTVCNNAKAPAKSITRKRWVDGGLVKFEGCEKTTRVLSSGGISCGLDASLFLVKETLGIGAAWSVAEMMDYNWNAQAHMITPAVLMRS